MANTKLQKLAIQAIEDVKANDITRLDVRKLTNVTDTMIICTGSSKRHVHTIADNLVTEAKHNGFQPLGVEGEEYNEWVLVDLGDVVVHIMLPETRIFYSLEKLWATTASMRKSRTTDE